MTKELTDTEKLNVIRRIINAWIVGRLTDYAACLAITLFLQDDLSAEQIDATLKKGTTLEDEQQAGD